MWCSLGSSDKIYKPLEEMAAENLKNRVKIDYKFDRDFFCLKNFVGIYQKIAR